MKSERPVPRGPKNNGMKTARPSWYRARQAEAMVEQFKHPDAVDQGELRSWKRIRRAAESWKLQRSPR